MAAIAILCSPEAGHLYPSFGLAEALRQDGHDITYLVMEDMERSVREAGFSTEVILSDIYPAGSPMEQIAHLLPLLNGALDRALAQIKPDLLLIDYSYSLEALLLYYRYSIRQAIFCTYLREPEHTPKRLCTGYIRQLDSDIAAALLEFILQLPGYANCKTIEQIVAPLTSITELILCPRELDVPEREFNGQTVYHMGPCSRNRTRALVPGSAVMDAAERGEKLIYVSFGSQISRYSDSFTHLIDELCIIARREAFVNHSFVITTGDLQHMKEVADLPPNVVIMKWVRQDEWISKSDLVITHGGLGCIKECIFFEVPMIVVPMMRDQPDNALRVVRHNLGRKIDANMLSADHLGRTICEVLNDRTIKERMTEMKTVFSNIEREKRESWIVDEILK